MTNVLARLEGIVRRYGSVTALDGADLELRAGEIHGVLGENGAGKSTLLEILGGGLSTDAGTITLGGHDVVLASPRDAWAHGVGMVHQHFKLVPRLTVLENLALGGRSGSGWRLPLGDFEARVRELMTETGLRVPLASRVEDLGVGDRQRTEILKALLRDPAVLVLDEPTPVLTPTEVEALFALLRRLADGGRGVVLVAHKLDEVLAVADRVTVLRGGRTVLTAPVADVTAESLAVAMVGEGAAALAGEGAAGKGVDGPRAASTEVVAACVNARVETTNGSGELRGVTLELHRGEIVGVAGVAGNGQGALARLFAGRSEAGSGEVRLPSGVGFVPQDRSIQGLALEMSLAENVALLEYRSLPGPRLDWRAIAAVADRVRSDFDVRAPDVDVRAASLSGGNQQRLVVGREMRAARALLVAENPTRGLDVAAAAFVHRTLREAVASSHEPPAVLLISTDLDEVLALSDRVFVMVRGELAEVADPTRHAVALAMLGGEAE